MVQPHSTFELRHRSASWTCPAAPFLIYVRLCRCKILAQGDNQMSLNRILLYAASCALVFACAISLAGLTGSAAPPAPSGDAKTDQEVLKVNAECNAAELRADIAAMDACETEDFTHTHASGQVEYKAEYLKGIGSGAHKF